MFALGHLAGLTIFFSEVRRATIINLSNYQNIITYIKLQITQGNPKIVANVLFLGFAKRLGSYIQAICTSVKKLKTKRVIYMNNKLVDYCKNAAEVTSTQVEKVLEFLIKEECTVPFVARYRKEATGNLDETKIRLIQKLHDEYIEKEKRRAFILETLDGMGVLTAELRSTTECAQTLTELEDIYAPYKSKRKTKATIARENGLESLANLIFTSNKTIEVLESEFFKTEKINTFEDALEGAKHIIIEKISHNTKVKEALRTLYLGSGQFTTLERKDAKENKAYLNFKDYFNFSEPLKNLFSPKSSHRFLAMSRGESLKILSLSIKVDFEEVKTIIEEIVIPSSSSLGCLNIVKDCVEAAYKKHMHLSIECEYLSELKKLQKKLRSRFLVLI